MPRIKTEIIERNVLPDGKENTVRQYKEVVYGDEPPFIKMYLEDILFLNGLSSQYHNVLNCLLKETRYASEEDGLCIVLASYTKKRILKELGWKNMQSLDNALHKLKQYNIIYSLDRGLYRLNPYLFGRGRWQDICKIRMTVDYDAIDGRTINTTIDNALTDNTNLNHNKVFNWGIYEKNTNRLWHIY